MRYTLLAFTSALATAFARPADPTPSTTYGDWDVSVTYASFPSGAWGRNLTAIYTDTSNGIWQIVDCITQQGPDIEQVDYCFNPAFSYELDDGLIKVKQQVSGDNTVRDLVGCGKLEITCTSETACSARGSVTATIADRRMDGKTE